eukprot:9142509-Ditylum_brightwellii.AAC.1
MNSKTVILPCLAADVSCILHPAQKDASHKAVQHAVEDMIFFAGLRTSSHLLIFLHDGKILAWTVSVWVNMGGMKWTW